MDYFTILAQQSQFHRQFSGKTVEIVRLSGQHAVHIGFSDSDHALKLSATPGMPYAHTIDKRYIPVRNARDWHQAKFTGSTLDNVAVTHGDRILTFTFGSGYRLIFEMTGRNANIVTIDAKGLIKGATRTITSRVSGFREVRPGIDYSPPPERAAIDLVWGALPILENRLRENDGLIGDELAVSLCAGSRHFAGEALAMCGLDPGKAIDALTAEDVVKLLKTLAELAHRIEKGGEGGTVLSDSEGLPVDVFPLPMQTAGESCEYFDDLDEALSRYSRNREYGLEYRQLKQSMVSGLKREEKSLRSTIKKVERERGDAAGIEKLEHRANTILANLHKISKGMEVVVLTDPYGDGDVEVELEATLDGAGNAERLFSRARKIKAASKLAVKRIAGLVERIERIAAERERITALDDIKELRKAAGLHKKKGPSGKGRDDDRPFPRRFCSRAGLEIIVGRNDKENDKLLRWAGKNDIWLHAQGVGGSHVVMQSPGKQNPDHYSVELAAAIAAYFSKSKTSAVVPVAWTRVKYVTKRRGQGPGQVNYTREKVVFVEPGLPKDDDKV